MLVPRHSNDVPIYQEVVFCGVLPAGLLVEVVGGVPGPSPVLLGVPYPEDSRDDDHRHDEQEDSQVDDVEVSAL